MTGREARTVTAGQCPAWLGIAAVLLTCGVANWAGAAETPAPVTTPAPQPVIDRAALIRSADLALQGNRFIEAQALLDRLSEAPTAADQSQVDLLRAEWLVATGRAVEAAPLLAALAPAESDGCRAAAARGLVFMQADDWDAADALLLGRSGGCGEDPVFWRALGRLHLARERAGAAAEAFEKALALQPGNDAIRNDLAVALIAAGKPDEAAPMLADLAQREPGQAETLINLDYANGMMGRSPARRDTDDDVFWSRRLQYAGYGALSAGKAALGEALLGQALIERPRYDAQLWQQYSEVSGKK